MRNSVSSTLDRVHQPRQSGFLTSDNSSITEETSENLLPFYEVELHEIPLDKRMEKKFQALKKHLIDLDDYHQIRLQASIKYLETHSAQLIDLAKNSSQKTLYIHPSKIGDSEDCPLPFHIEISISSSGKPLIFLFPKDQDLGQGSFKKVRVAIDYIHEIKVASATIPIQDTFELHQSLREYRIQKLFSKAYSSCVYFLGSNIKHKIVMPYANWGGLSNFITPAGHTALARHFPKELQQKMLDKLLEFINLAHQKGWVIGDIKPHNILLNTDSEKQELDIFITDFGTAYKANNQKAIRYVGTPLYMGPEFLTAQGKRNPKLINEKVDIYALGKTLWEVFVGGVPAWCIDVPKLGYWYKPEEYQKSWAQFYKTSIRKMPRNSLERLIHKMMHPDPKKRPSMEMIQRCKPKLSLGSPTYQNMRLLSNKESIGRFKLVQEAWKKAWPKKLPVQECYTLVKSPRGRKGKTFLLCTTRLCYRVKLLKDGRVQISNEKKDAKVYENVNAFVKQMGLQHCLNFFT